PRLSGDGEPSGSPPCRGDGGPESFDARREWIMSIPPGDAGADSPVRGLVAMIAVAIAAASVPVGAQDSTARPLRKRTTVEDLQMFSQVLNQIRVNHPDSVDTHDLFMAAVEGMVHAADPHSYVIPAV